MPSSLRIEIVLRLRFSTKNIAKGVAVRFVLLVQEVFDLQADADFLCPDRLDRITQQKIIHPECVQASGVVLGE